MNHSKGLSWIFAVLGVLLAACAVVLCFTARNASAKLLISPKGAQQCCEALLDRVCAGDFTGASKYLYGNPRLDSGEQQDSDTGKAIWDAFVDSLSYELIGDSYAASNGIAQKVRITSLQIPSVTDALKGRAQTLLDQRVKAAQEMDEIYDDNLEFRSDFVLAVLRDAAGEAASADGQVLEQEVEVNLVYDRNQWWVVPDSALLAAISGGILGN